jgi:hypothetical protein
MPRYYFHIEDDCTYIDRVGVELPDLEAARDEAVSAAGQILRNGAANRDPAPWLYGRCLRDRCRLGQAESFAALGCVQPKSSHIGTARQGRGRVIPHPCPWPERESKSVG